MFLILSIFLFGLISKEIRQQFLETLERRMVFEELKPDQIREVFTKEYLGETTRDWVLLIESKMKELCDNYLEAVDDGKNEFEKMDQIDKEYKYEIGGRKKQICNKAQEPLYEYLSFVEKIISHVDHLVGQGAFLSDKELIQRIISSWKSQIADVEESFGTLCRTCKSVCEVDSAEGQKCKEFPVEQRHTL